MDLIDWPGVIRNVLWIVGLSVALAAFSYISWWGAAQGLRLRRSPGAAALSDPLFSRHVAFLRQAWPGAPRVGGSAACGSCWASRSCGRSSYSGESHENPQTASRLGDLSGSGRRLLAAEEPGHLRRSGAIWLGAACLPRWVWASWFGSCSASAIGGARIPGFTLLSVGTLLIMASRGINLGDWRAPLVLFGIAFLGFWVALLVQGANWWAAIPAGVLTLLGFLIGLQARLGETLWLSAILFGGLGVVFLLVLLIRGGQSDARWLAIPAAALILLGIATLVGVLTSVPVLLQWWPVLLLVGWLGLADWVVGSHRRTAAGVGTAGELRYHAARGRRIGDAVAAGCRQRACEGRPAGRADQAPCRADDRHLRPDRPAAAAGGHGQAGTSPVPGNCDLPGTAVNLYRNGHKSAAVKVGLA